MTKHIYKVYNDKYVAAIIQGSFELGQWLISVPKERLDSLTIEPINHIHSYPFTLAEINMGKKRLFTVVRGAGNDGHDLQALKNIGMKVLATYTIRENFYGDPKNPGLDYMGILDHEHEAEDDE